MADEVINIGPPPLEDMPDLPDAVITQIHAGLIIPSRIEGRIMAREIRKWRGEKNPDSV